ncbi:MFS transporter [Clostridium sp. MT-14]|jgi:MFS family permease|uniref:MFS transporter n=1 Tax=unclassified Clostridium TaxID=2614128 RepID=UPI00123B1FEB|nr:MFS transporter [Clostridium sp. HV4-5-A1G]KAA8668672.1 MFS transporter [Clostridium sp. HV4-5-A1G]CAB1261869.1 Putative tartrate transporter [Clostridiaceae bacterium BL-3]
METEVKKIPKRRWTHIIPVCILVYIVAFMDRTNISFAIAGGMSEALNLTASMSGLASGIFFIGYMVLQIPGGNMAEHGSAKKFISFSIIAWSIFAIVEGFVHNSTQLLILRFCLGVAEGGVWPAILVIITHWFPMEERGRANAFFIMNLAVANMITGPISSWLIVLSSWRLLFIGEGILALLLMLCWLPLITDRPENAKWLSKEEKDYIDSKLAEEKAAMDKNVAAKLTFGQALRNINMVKLSIVYFCYQIGVYGFTLWLPTLLKSISKTGITGIGFLSMFPFVAGMVGLWVFGNISDKTHNSKMSTAIPMLLFGVCLICSVQFGKYVWVSYAFMIGCGAFYEAGNGPFWTMPPMLFSADVAGGCRGVINAIGNLGGFVGPYVVGALMTRYNNAVAGMWTLGVFLIIGFFVAVSLPAVTSGRGFRELEANSKAN